MIDAKILLASGARRLSLCRLAGAGVSRAVHARGLEGARAGRVVHLRPSGRRRHLGRAGGRGDHRRQPARRDAVRGARLRLRLLSHLSRLRARS